MQPAYQPVSGTTHELLTFRALPCIARVPEHLLSERLLCAYSIPKRTRQGPNAKTLLIHDFIQLRRTDSLARANTLRNSPLYLPPGR